jgi:YegS/Rv2252/BmrU family lipid kinase
MRHFAVFVNPRAGKGKPLKVLPAVKQAMERAGCTFDVFTANLPTTLRPYTDIVIVGGDGTVNYIINQFPDISIPIGIVPAGSGNDLAFTLFPNSHLAEQIENALHGEVLRIDAGLCNNRIFLNCLGIGFDGEVAKDIPGIKWLSGSMKYYWVVIKKIISYRSQFLQVTWNEGSNERSNDGRIFMVTAANGYRSGGGFKVAPDADWQDGLLELVIIHPLPVWQRIFCLPRIEKGAHMNLSFVESCKTKKVLVKSAKAVAGHLDGEIIDGCDFDISVMRARYLFRGRQHHL